MDWVQQRLVEIKGGSLSAEDEEYSATFVKSLLTIEVSRFRSLAEEHDAPNTDEILCNIDDEESQLEWYFGLRAYDKFVEETGRLPGATDASLAEDASRIEELGSALLAAAGVSRRLKSDVAAELARYHDCELHVTSAYLGGVAAQEAVKLLTKQYTPFNNTFIWNGIVSHGATIEL